MTMERNRNKDDMSKIELNETNSGYNLQKINDNFKKIAKEFNEKVLYRDNPVGEPNEMQNDLDMDGNRIYNLPTPREDHEAARLKDVQDAIVGTINANLIQFSPTDDISSPTVQGAIEEVYSKGEEVVEEVVEGLYSTQINNGTFLIGNSIISLNSVQELLSLPLDTVQNGRNQLYRVIDYHGDWVLAGRSPRGGGLFKYIPESFLDVDGGVVLEGPNGIGRFVRIISNYVSPDFWGAIGNGVTDDTDAIQSAVDYYPINEDDPGVISPKGFANGGRVSLTRGRYKVTKQIILNRGINFQGEGRESTQLLSYSLNGVLIYYDKGRYHPDELKFSDFSIWQDESVIPTAGAGIAVIDTGLVPVAALTPTLYNLTIEGTFVGIRMNLLIGASLRDSLISKCVFHGVAIEGTNSSTSVTIQNTYSQQNGGSGFFVDTAAYISFISTASDSNVMYGYDIRRVKNIAGVAAGAEVNRYSAAFVQCEGVNWNGFGIGNSLGGVLLTQCREVIISGHLEGDVGTGVLVTDPTGPTTLTGLTLRGIYASSPHNNPQNLIHIGNSSGEIMTTRGVIRMASTSGPIIRASAGNPEGGVVASPGSLFMRTDTGALYVKQSGTGNTGWVEK